MYVADKHLGKTCRVLVGELSSTQAQKKRMFLSLNMPAVDSTAWVNGIAPYKLLYGAGIIAGAIFCHFLTIDVF